MNYFVYLSIRSSVGRCSIAVVMVLFLVVAANANEIHHQYSECDVARQLACQLSDSNYINPLLSHYPMTVIDYIAELKTYLLCVEPGYSSDSIASLCEGDPKVNYCHRNYEFDLPEVVQGSQPFVDRPGDRDHFVEQSAASNLNLSVVDALPFGAPVRVAVIDVGVDLQHPLLSTSISSGFDYVSGDAVAQDEPNGSASGHGTFVAGIIHRIIPQAQISAYRVLDTNGRGTGWEVALAMLQAIADSCKVINLSLVMHEKHECVDNAIELARDLNIVVVAASGNDSSAVPRFPANDSYVLGVTAVDSTNHRASFANYGNHLDVCAPGVALYAPYPDSAFALWSGTSFAAPFVSAQAAWLFSLKPTATWNEVVDAIRSSAIDIDSLNLSIPNGSLGNGLINLQASFEALGLVCGDLDQSGIPPDVGDLSILVDHLFITFGQLPNMAIANIDATGNIDVGDLTMLVDHLFITHVPINCGF